MKQTQYDRPGELTTGPEIDSALGGTVQEKLRIARQASKRVSCEAIKEFVDSHLYSADLCPLKAAQSLRISQRYLHKIFAESGSTFCQYVHRRRLELSREKLADPNAAHRPICDIALELGFYDHAHFTRAFRKAYGLTPKAFRKAGV